MTQIPEWANWLARDKNGTLAAFENKPHRYRVDIRWYREPNVGDSLYFDAHNRCQNIEETDDTYSHIKWEDEGPTPMEVGE